LEWRGENLRLMGCQCALAEEDLRVGMVTQMWTPGLPLVLMLAPSPFLLAQAFPTRMPSHSCAPRAASSRRRAAAARAAGTRPKLQHNTRLLLAIARTICGRLEAGGASASSEDGSLCCDAASLMRGWHGKPSHCLTLSVLGLPSPWATRVTQGSTLYLQKRVNA
jgi:hypothetical protein